MCINNSCNKKVDASSTTSTIGHCTKCSTAQRLDRCKKQLYGKVIIRNNSGESKDLNIFLPMIRKIVNDETITDEDEIKGVETKLLSSEKFTARYKASTETVDAVVRCTAE